LAAVDRNPLNRAPSETETRRGGDFTFCYPEDHIKFLGVSARFWLGDDGFAAL
jgi:hypothetical protein